MKSLSGLLRLPRELRDVVYAYIFDESEIRPDNPSASGPRISEGTLGLEDTVSQRQLKNTPLTTVNRQLRQEVQDYLSNLQRLGRKRAAELDIMFEDNVSWPKWIYFPPEAARGVAFDLNVQLRVFSTETFRNHDGWHLVDMNAAFLDLLLLLNRFVRYGPSFREPSHLTGPEFVPSFDTRESSGFSE